jgi:hypothetical protein
VSIFDHQQSILTSPLDFLSPSKRQKTLRKHGGLTHSFHEYRGLCLVSRQVVHSAGVRRFGGAQGLFKFRSRGLWLLIGLPFAAYWLLAFFVFEDFAFSHH